MGAHILEEAEAIKASIDQALPPALRDRLLKFQLTLTLGTSSLGPFQVVGAAEHKAGEVVVIDADELAERELAGHMVSLPKYVTGVDNTIFVSTKGYGRHAPRIKIAIDPPNSFNETCINASMAIHNFSITGAYVPPWLVEQAKAFIERNRDLLLDYWNGEFDTGELFKRLRPP
jgi:hypothetical protein